jgi:hypothetical protein
MNDDKTMKNILLSIKTIASVGLSSNIEKESYWIVSYLKDQGYHVIPVNPTATEILGEKAYGSGIRPGKDRCGAGLPQIRRCSARCGGCDQGRCKSGLDAGRDCQ